MLPPVHWSFYDGGEQGEDPWAYPLQSCDGWTWNDISHPEEIDGTLLQVSNRPGQKLWLNLPSPDGEMLRIEPPSPTHFFGFTRLSQSIGLGDTRWLYSCFGYVLPDYVYVTKIFPGQPTRILEACLLPRPCVFPI